MTLFILMVLTIRDKFKQLAFLCSDFHDLNQHYFKRFCSYASGMARGMEKWSVKMEMRFDTHIYGLQMRNLHHFGDSDWLGTGFTCRIWSVLTAIGWISLIP